MHERVRHKSWKNVMMSKMFFHTIKKPKSLTPRRGLWVTKVALQIPKWKVSISFYFSSKCVLFLYIFHFLYYCKICKKKCFAFWCDFIHLNYGYIFVDFSLFLSSPFNIPTFKFYCLHVTWAVSWCCFLAMCQSPFPR